MTPDRSEPTTNSKENTIMTGLLTLLDAIRSRFATALSLPGVRESPPPRRLVRQLAAATCGVPEHLHPDDLDN